MPKPHSRENIDLLIPKHSYTFQENIDLFLRESSRAFQQPLTVPPMADYRPLQDTQDYTLRVQLRSDLTAEQRIQLLTEAQAGLAQSTTADYLSDRSIIRTVIASLRAGNGAAATERPVRHHPTARTPFSTDNQRRLDELGVTEFPDEIRCAISTQIMDDPVRIKNGNMIVDRAVWNKLRKHPMSNEPKQPDDIESCPELKARIDSFMADPQNPQNTAEQGPAEQPSSCTIL